MSKLQLREEIVGANPQTVRRVDNLVEMLGKDSLTEQISDDMVKFIFKMGDMHKFSLKRYVVVYLNYLAKKYGVPITKSYLCHVYDVNSKGWMKKLGDLRRVGLIEEINIQETFLVPAIKLIDEMSETKLIGLIQYQLATRCISNLFVDYPHLKGSNPHILFAFAAIYTTNKMSINEVAMLFFNLDLKLDRDGRSKVWYYQTFRRVTARAGLVSLT
ncbi:MAG: hypothetical protein GPJ54_01635 [Candidatus Heimdallarchaeota archaeon]|nr:hypothetical protein [Candidatus Heimdallarchaeota archaeon]